MSPSYFAQLVRLSYLAPNIIQVILDGRQPREPRVSRGCAPLGWRRGRQGGAGAGQETRTGTDISVESYSSTAVLLTWSTVITAVAVQPSSQLLKAKRSMVRCSC